jgi:hypothetical protein
MGSVVPASPEEQRELTIEADGWDCLDAVEVIKNGHVVRSCCGFGLASIAGAKRFKVGVEWGYHGYPDEREWRFSVVARDGSILGCNPRFKPPGFHRARVEGPRRLEVYSKTRSKGQGGGHYQRVDLDLQGTLDTRVTIRDADGDVLTATIGELLIESKALIPFGPYSGAYYLSRATAEPHFHTVVEWEDADRGHEQSRDYYYVRVFQKNGQACWSSPIWIDHP